MKKILYVGTKLENFLGGAEKSIFNLLSSIRNEYYVEVVTFDNSRKQGSYKINEILIHNYHMKNIPYFYFFKYYFNNFWIKKILNQYKGFDIYISQVFGAAYYLKILKTLFPDAKTIYFVRDEFSLNIFKNYRGGFNKIVRNIKDFVEFFFIYVYKRKNKFALFSNEVVVNSKFMQNLIKKLFGLRAKIIYPILEIENKKPKNLERRNYITMFHTSPFKGINIFLKIAKRLSNQKFYVFGKYPIKKRKPSNIKFFKRTKNMDIVYNKTKLILIPSLCMEGFGRIPIEAACYYIPVISSNRGGLTESSVNGVLINNDITNIDEWIKKIKEVLSNYEDYVNSIDLSKFEKYKKDYQIANFKKILSELAG